VNDIRQLSVQMYAGAGGEELKSYQQRLVVEMSGKALTEDAVAEASLSEELDRDGLNFLRNMC
jgi:hypothetical protein